MRTSDIMFSLKGRAQMINIWLAAISKRWTSFQAVLAPAGPINQRLLRGILGFAVFALTISYLPLNAIIWYVYFTEEKQFLLVLQGDHPFHEALLILALLFSVSISLLLLIIALADLQRVLRSLETLLNNNRDIWNNKGLASKLDRSAKMKVFYERNLYFFPSCTMLMMMMIGCVWTVSTASVDTVILLIMSSMIPASMLSLLGCILLACNVAASIFSKANHPQQKTQASTGRLSCAVSLLIQKIDNRMGVVGKFNRLPPGEKEAARIVAQSLGLDITNKRVMRDVVSDYDERQRMVHAQARELAGKTNIVSGQGSSRRL